MSDSPSGIRGKSPAGPHSAAPVDDNIVTADESFADDALGARLKRSESQKRKHAKERNAAEQRRRLASFQKVREASGFHLDKRPGTQHATRAKPGPEHERALRPLEKDVASGRGDPLTEQEVHVEQLMAELTSLVTELDAAGRAEAATIPGREGEVTDRAARLLELVERVNRIEHQLRDALRTLLLGGLGFKLARDPAVAFRRLFERIDEWPARVPPGHEPDRASEFDAFVSWVFKAPDVSAEELARCDDLFRT